MSVGLIEGTQIEIVHEIDARKVRHALFDFDGTVSLLREGWQRIMAPLCVEMICGETPPTPAIEAEVREMIEETTGIQTILQMERLVGMVKSHGLVAEDKILDPYGYKDIYNDRLMVPVRERLARLADGSLTVEQSTVRGVYDFLDAIKSRDIPMYVFSGTDRDDVRNEAKALNAAPYFQEIWGALRTVAEYSKEKIIAEIMAKHDLHGVEVMAVGDGPVEVRNVKAVGGIAIGVASDEVTGYGWDEEKRERLRRAGADILVPDFGEAAKLVSYLFKT